MVAVFLVQVASTVTVRVSNGLQALLETKPQPISAIIHGKLIVQAIKSPI